MSAEGGPPAALTRVSDAERKAVVDRLRLGASEGRLDPEELEQRVASAYAARTRGELDAVVAALPAPAPEPPGRAARLDGDDVRRRVAGFLVPNIICLIVWA